MLEQRNVVCMTCGRVGSWKNRPTFEELAVMFEGSTASGAERAYRKAILHLAEHLIADDAIHPIHLKQKSNKYAKTAISYLLHCKNVDLLKDAIIPFEP